jgi:hypothetical protein
MVDAAFLRRQWDRFGAWACVVVGAVALLVGWLGVSDTPYPAEQIPFVISGGIGGVFFLGVGAMLWISADIHDEWRKLDEVGDLVRQQLELLHEARTLDLAPAERSNGRSRGRLAAAGPKVDER